MNKFFDFIDIDNKNIINIFLENKKIIKAIRIKLKHKLKLFL